MSDLDSYHIHRSKGAPAPILISIPHSGTLIPEDIRNRMTAIGQSNIDADWWLPELYNFAPSMGIQLIEARLSRYVVDLNRPTASQNLYQDGRKETVVVPTHSFEGKNLYNDGEQPRPTEIADRLRRYYEPYHLALQQNLKQLRRTYPHVLLYDAHSIARTVSTISTEAFPDLILGDVDGHSARPDLSQCVLDQLKSSGYSFQYNLPFKGGAITRQEYGEGISRLQLERSQDIYMTDGQLDAQKAKRLRERCLIPLMESLLDRLSKS